MYTERFVIGINARYTRCRRLSNYDMIEDWMKKAHTHTIYMSRYVSGLIINEIVQLSDYNGRKMGYVTYPNH